MALTAKVKDELLRATGGTLDVRAAEATALIRFGGELRHTEGGVEIVADFEEEAVARRLAGTIADLCAVDAAVELVSSSAGSREPRYEVRVGEGAADVIRRLKLVTGSGHPVVGMPRQVISGPMAG
ncbi:DNA-binding protein WhiA, partial [Corynebacterium fournieri]